MPSQAAMVPGIKHSRSTPVIPEEGPAPSITDFPRSSLDAACMMPTLLEQLQVSIELPVPFTDTQPLQKANRDHRWHDRLLCSTPTCLAQHMTLVPR